MTRFFFQLIPKPKFDQCCDYMCFCSHKQNSHFNKSINLPSWYIRSGLWSGTTSSSPCCAWFAIYKDIFQYFKTSMPESVQGFIDYLIIES